MLRKIILGALVLVVFGVLAPLTLGKTAVVTAQGPRAAIWTDKSEYKVGDLARLCYTVPQPAYIEITDILADGTSKVFLSGNDDGTGDCLNGTIEPPTGMETLRLTVYSGNQVIATAETRFRVLGTESPSQPVQPKVQGTYTIDSDLTVPAGVTGAQIDEAIRRIRADSPLIGLGDTFVSVGNRLGINAIYMAAHAAWESTWGTSKIARDKNNLFGYGAYDKCPYECAWTFASKQECVEKIFPVIKAQYLTPGGSYYTSDGPTLRGMNRHYATDQNWKNGIASIMNSLAANLGGNNLARGKSAYASSVERGDEDLFGPGNATDGNSSTRWSSRQQYEGGQNEEWLVVDLQGSHRVNKAVLRWESACATAYRVYIWNGSDWEEVASKNDGRGGVESISFPTRTTDTVALLFTSKTNPSWGYSLWEVEVYGP